MKLDELLDELRVGILNDRSDRVSGTSDYLWTDARLIRYIDEAERRFARFGLVIRDNETAECCDVSIVTGQQEYTLHESVIAVISAKLDGEVADLARAGHSIFDAYRGPQSHFFDPAVLSEWPAGKPLAFSTDEGFALDDADSSGVIKLKIFPEPTAAYSGEVIKLRVIRLPIAHLTASNLKKAPEIPEIHHLDMLDWAAYLALRIQDQDAGSPRAAMEFAASFNKHVLDAKNTVLRKMFVPQTWGFGRGGWSW